MILSEKKKQLAYNAISESIIDVRIELAKNNHDKETIDEHLFQLERRIWNRLRAALNIADS